MKKLLCAVILIGMFVVSSSLMDAQCYSNCMNNGGSPRMCIRMCTF
jgi:hypothetical protein